MKIRILRGIYGKNEGLRRNRNSTIAKQQSLATNKENVQYCS